MKKLKIAVLIMLAVIVFATAAFCAFGSFYIHDMGNAELKEGSAEVALEGLPESYQVVLTPLGACGQLYISEKTTEKFVVKEKFSGEKGTTMKFDYVILSERTRGSNVSDEKLEEMKKKFEEMNINRQGDMQQRIEELKQKNNTNSQEEGEPGESGAPETE